MGDGFKIVEIDPRDRAAAEKFLAGGGRKDNLTRPEQLAALLAEHRHTAGAEDQRDILNLVNEMRVAQRELARTGSVAAMVKARHAEREVDTALAAAARPKLF